MVIVDMVGDGGAALVSVFDGIPRDKENLVKTLDKENLVKIYLWVWSISSALAHFYMIFRNFRSYIHPLVKRNFQKTVKN